MIGRHAETMPTLGSTQLHMKTLERLKVGLKCPGSTNLIMRIMEMAQTLNGEDVISKLVESKDVIR